MKNLIAPNATTNAMTFPISNVIIFSCNIALPAGSINSFSNLYPPAAAIVGTAKKKENSGINVFYTQPIISHKAIENLKLARKELNGYIMGGIMPVVSYENAIFMDAEISGISIEEVIQKYLGADKDLKDKLAVEIATYFGEKIKEYVDGYYIITPFNRVDLVEKVIENLR